MTQRTNLRASVRLAMNGATTAFFESLAGREHEPLLAYTKGTVRVDLADGAQTERWLVSFDKGKVAVSHRNVGADCTLHTTKDLFEGIVRGEVNAMAAVLRGAVAIDGDWELLIVFQRLLPEPGA
jgi:putative sterol carrier protein